MSDEEDYMSDKFLANLSDVRPSLINSRTNKRKVEVTVKQIENIKRQRDERNERTGTNRNEKLQESLSKPIAAENKGYQLLAKMGYKPGQALGKDSASASNSGKRTDPIGINIKLDRGGLGREAALQELAEKRRELRLKYLQRKAGIDVSISTDEFRRRATQKAEERYTLGALKRCQLSCETLDTDAGIKEPEMKWFWPERIEYNDNDELDNADCAGECSDEEADDTEEYTATEKLELLICYLRTSYTFCFWCGVHYKDKDDMDSNCPGLTRDDH